MPKVDREAEGDAQQLRRQLIRMLAVAHDVPIADDTSTMIGTQNYTILEVLIARFLGMLTEALRRGMPRSYKEFFEDLPALRGRLDITRQFTSLAASPHRLACRYDEFSTDVAVNQVLKAPITKLNRLTRSRSNQRLIGELALLYADVSAVATNALPWHPIVPDRSNTRWMELVRLAKLILGERFQNSAHGDASGFALLFDMNVLFERYVEKLLQPIAEAHHWTLNAQGGARHCLHPEDASKSVFETFPDIQLTRRNEVGLVIDTKWKRLIDRSRAAKMDVEQGDIYQMMAYGQLYRCERLVLLYPHHGGLSSPLPVRFRVAERNGSTKLTIATIDLTSHASAREGLRALVRAGEAVEA